MTNDVKIAVIAGDGIGCEVIPAGMAAIETAVKGSGLSLSFTEFPWGCEYYTKHGRMMEEGGFERVAAFDAIYLGAIGAPTVPDHIAVWDLILPLRQRFDQYVNLRPMRLLPGLTSPLANRGPPRRHGVRARTPRAARHRWTTPPRHALTRCRADRRTPRHRAHPALR